jgi:hypothetical protein
VTGMRHQSFAEGSLATSQQGLEIARFIQREIS